MDDNSVSESSCKNSASSSSGRQSCAVSSILSTLKDVFEELADDRLSAIDDAPSDRSSALGVAEELFASCPSRVFEKKSSKFCMMKSSSPVE